jgi:membrane protein implicated in regulation of membrane protease activity
MVGRVLWCVLCVFLVFVFLVFLLVRRAREWLTKKKKEKISKNGWLKMEGTVGKKNCKKKYTNELDTPIRQACHFTLWGFF